jgi:iron complex outermembrane receptor protein
MNKAIFTLAIIGFNFSGISQENDVKPSKISLDTVQVTSNRTIQNITQTGRNVQVMTSNDIQSLPINSTDELLRFLPGIEIQSRGGFGVQSDMTLRGSTFNQVLVMVDGVRVNDPLTGHFNGYVPVPLAEIDRVEIIKGTASSIYGADAVGGVINFITKTDTKNERADVNATLKAGSYGYIASDISVLAKAKKWCYSVGFQNNKSDGEQLLNPNFGEVPSAPVNFNTWFNTQTISGSVGRELGENWKVNLRGSYDERSFAAKYFYTASKYDESVENTTVFFSDLKLSGSNGKFKTDIDFAFRESTDEFIFNPLFTANNHTTRFGLLQANQSFAYSSKHTLVYGIQIDSRNIESNDRGNHSNFHSGFYGQWIGKMVSNLTTTVSLRGDYDDNYDFELSPQLSVSYIIKKVVLRGGLGKGIRAADYTERFVSNNLNTLSPGRNLGNPDLVAESSWSYELGADYYLMDGLKLVATGFYRASSNLIDYVPTQGSEITNVPVTLVPNGTYLYSKNLTNVNTVGLEAELWYSKVTKSGNRYSAKLGYTGLESVNPDGTVSKYVSSHAKHLVNGNLSASVGIVDFGFSGLYKTREEVYTQALGLKLNPEYFVANANIGVRLLSDKLTVKGEVINLFDEKYSDILGAQMPGRWFVVGLSLRL